MVDLCTLQFAISRRAKMDRVDIEAEADCCMSYLVFIYVYFSINLTLPKHIHIRRCAQQPTLQLLKDFSRLFSI